jgi:hypothetical protein
MNATEQLQRYKVEVTGLPGITLDATDTVEVLPAQARWITVSVRVPAQTAADIGPGAHPIGFKVGRLAKDAQDKTTTATEKSTFVVPR